MPTGPEATAARRTATSPIASATRTALSDDEPAPAARPMDDCEETRPPPTAG